MDTNLLYYTVYRAVIDLTGLQLIIIDKGFNSPHLHQYKYSQN